MIKILIESRKFGGHELVIVYQRKLEEAIEKEFYSLNMFNNKILLERKEIENIEVKLRLRELEQKAESKQSKLASAAIGVSVGGTIGWFLCPLRAAVGGVVGAGIGRLLG